MMLFVKSMHWWLGNRYECWCRKCRESFEVVSWSQDNCSSVSVFVAVCCSRDVAVTVQLPTSHLHT